MTVCEIVEKYLKDNGFDGLAGEGRRYCGCKISDLMCCGEPNPNCKAGYKIICKDCSELDCVYRGEKTDCIVAKK